MKKVKLRDTTLEDLAKAYFNIHTKYTQMDFFSYVRIDLELSAGAERMANAYKKVFKQDPK